MIEKPFRTMQVFHRNLEEGLRLLQLAAADGTVEHIREALESVQALAHEYVLHAEDEEVSLFPRLRPLLSGSNIAQLQVLEEQHAEATHAYEVLEEQLARWSKSPGQRVPEPELDLFRRQVEHLSEAFRFHASFEDRELLGLARRLLTKEQIAAIWKEMEERRQPRIAEAASGS